MKYKILVARAGSVWKTDFGQAAEELARAVEEAMDDGWEPQGGVAVGQTVATQAPYLLQAMIKKEG